MRISKFRGLAATAIAACALLTTGAGAASATPAVWNTTGGVTLTPTAPFTIKVGATPGPAETFTCSNITGITAVAATNAGVGSLSGIAFSAPQAPSGLCLDGYGFFPLVQFPSHSPLAMQAVKTGSVYSMSGVNGMIITIIGSSNSWSANGGTVSYTAPWTNGTSAVNPSRITFTNATIGVTSGSLPIKLTGTFTLKTSAGGLITLI